MISLSFVSQLENPQAYQSLLFDYYTIVLPVAEKAGLQKLSPTDMAADSMNHLEEGLPPNGRLLLARAEDGKLMGCGTLRRIRPDAVELKRVFVRPEAQGQKLGLKILQTLMTEAKSIGCLVIYGDTAKGNTPMTNLCEFLGFDYIDRYPENANPPEFEPYLVYMRRNLEGWNSPNPT